MKILKVGTVLLLAVTACMPRGGTVTNDIPASMVFDHVAVVDVISGTVSENMAVAVRGNRILSVRRSSGARFADATVIDATGKYLIPGLWDMHVHAFTSPESTYALGARATDVYFPQYLSAGVTGIRDMGGWVDTIMSVRRRVRGHQVLGPRIVAAGMLFGGKNPWAPSSPHVWVITSPDSARAAVDSMKRAGADFIKAHDFLSRESYFAIAAAARADGLPLVGHLRPAVTIDEAIAAGQTGMEHLPIELIAACAGGGQKEVSSFYDQWVKGGWPAFVRITDSLWSARKPGRCREIMETMKKAGAHITPTLVLRMQDSAFFRRVAQTDLTPAAVKRCSLDVKDWSKTADSTRALYYRTIFDVVQAFHAAGVGILAGTDGVFGCLVPGWSLHEELEIFVRAGLSPLEALRSATIVPARFMGMSDSLGTVAAGKIADLVLLERNPLTDIRNTRTVAGVVADGRWLSREALKNRGPTGRMASKTSPKRLKTSLKGILQEMSI
ncbi:MAG TPA: amidohydrolase family protein [Gemmatimonadaceae bacterium]|nr:amidohydrolase family protein [Gemmatimonadaceae bacterium]